MAGFNGIRSRLYRECLKEFPHAREEDIEVMKKYLAPKSNEIILEDGAGGGFFSNVIANMSKKLIVCDTSEEQLQPVKELRRSNIKVIREGSDSLSLETQSADAIWSFGSMHHCFDKTKAF